MSTINAAVLSDENSIGTILSAFPWMINVGTFIDSTSCWKLAFEKDLVHSVVACGDAKGASIL